MSGFKFERKLQLLVIYGNIQHMKCRVYVLSEPVACWLFLEFPAPPVVFMRINVAKAGCVSMHILLWRSAVEICISSERNAEWNIVLRETQKKIANQGTIPDWKHSRPKVWIWKMWYPGRLPESPFLFFASLPSLSSSKGKPSSGTLTWRISNHFQTKVLSPGLVIQYSNV